MITVTSTVTLASPSPDGGDPLPAGVPMQVDETDEFIRSLLNAGTLTEVGAQPATHILTPSPLDVSGTSPSADAGTTVTAQDVPSEEWTKDQLREYAEGSGIDVASGATKSDLLDAIRGTPGG